MQDVPLQGVDWASLSSQVQFPLLQGKQNISFAVLFGQVVVAVQLLGHVQLFETPRTIGHQAPLSFTVSWSLLRFMPVESVMFSHHLILAN